MMLDVAAWPGQKLGQKTSNFCRETFRWCLAAHIACSKDPCKVSSVPGLHVAFGRVNRLFSRSSHFRCSTQMVIVLIVLSGWDLNGLAGCTSLLLSCLALGMWFRQRLASTSDCHRGLHRPPCEDLEIGLIRAAKHRRTPILCKACPAAWEKLWNGPRVSLDDLQNAVLVAIAEMDAVCGIQQKVRSVFCQPLTRHPLGLKLALLKLLQNHMLGACHQIHVHQGADLLPVCAILSRYDLEGGQAMPIWTQTRCKEGRRHPGCFAVMPVVQPAAFAGAPALNLILALKHQHGLGMGQEQALTARPHLRPAWSCVPAICKNQKLVGLERKEVTMRGQRNSRQ